MVEENSGAAAEQSSLDISKATSTLEGNRLSFDNGVLEKSQDYTDATQKEYIAIPYRVVM